jgi:hypothetical protein
VPSQYNFLNHPNTDTDIISVREQIQNDLICLLSTQFDDEGQTDEVQKIACDIVVINFTPF